MVFSLFLFFFWFWRFHLLFLFISKFNFLISPNNTSGASLTELWKAFFHQLSMSLKSSMAFLSSVVSSCQCDFSIQRDGRAVSKRFYLPLGLLPQVVCSFQICEKIFEIFCMILCWLSVCIHLCY